MESAGFGKNLLRFDQCFQGCGAKSGLFSAVALLGVTHRVCKPLQTRRVSCCGVSDIIFGMTLFEKLAAATSEEDVKAAYIKALGLKDVQRNLIDIQTKEVWFEAKLGGKHSTYAMFTQLLNYVWVALRDGEEIPPFLCVIDSVKAAIMKTEVALPLLKDKSIAVKWGKSASDITPEALDAVSQFIGTHFVSFRIETQEREFVDTVKRAIASGEIVRTQITPDNLKQVFDRWVELVGREITGVAPDDYCLLFFADVMSDGTVSTHENLPAELLHRNGRPAFLLGGTLYPLGNTDGYRRFWAIYDRPPKEEYRNYLLERRDSLIPYDERSFKGAYYTPLHVVDKAYDLLAQTLGANWQRDHIVWDMCCGVGNLETKHGNARNVFMSTLDQPDVDVMKAAKTCRAATRFQYDYLNDDIAEDGSIDYSITNKLPQELRDALAAAREGRKKLLVLINPPYAEATNADNTAKGSKMQNKTGVAKTRWAQFGMGRYGRASNELFVQFITRIAAEIPNATLAMFSKMKYINAQALEVFRQQWNAEYLNGFIVHSKAFDGLKGNFPIGFLIWKTNNTEGAERTPITEVQTEVLDKNANPIGSKTFYNLPNSELLTNWIPRPKPNDQPCVPLTNAVEPPKAARLDQRGTKWSNGAVGYMCTATDMQHTKYVFLLSSGASMGHGAFVNADNFERAAVLFTVEHLVKPTWINDRDQFLQPSVELPQEFKDDCLVWMLFNGSNLTASANGLEWNGRTWSIVNHFIPFTEDEVDAPERFESDFMVRQLGARTLSSEAQSVLDAGRVIWRTYFERFESFDYAVREKLKLNRADVGWYQVRNALKLYAESSEGRPTDFSAFESAYKSLGDKLRPKVYEYGFLRQ